MLSKSDLKNLWITGYVPTQYDFSVLFDTMVVFDVSSGCVDGQSARMINLADPQSSTDAATMGWVQTWIGQQGYVQPVSAPPFGGGPIQFLGADPWFMGCANATIGILGNLRMGYSGNPGMMVLSPPDPFSNPSYATLNTIWGAGLYIDGYKAATSNTWVSTFYNDAGYLTSLYGQNISQLNNDAGYLTSINLSGHNVSELNNDSGYLTSINLSGHNVSELNNDTGYLTSLSGHNVSELNNDAGYSTFSPNQAGELYSCFGIFDGGSATNGVSVGGGFVRLVLYNGGQQVIVLDGGTKQLIGYADYQNPSPTIAACWSDGVLRDGNGTAFLTSETDPVFSAWDKSTGISITLSQISDYVAPTISAVLSNSSITPVADGTYTVGIGTIQNGTITISSGIITTVQEAS